ncbi:putative acetolactate synthase large subunit IlvX [bioreactor metagenome]|uniref:Putative acetolactate synthase large subunit IlvX n=1 Tax=bioreactor metagenome TaxID=1076179 RepID=A0A645B6K0_9ZZZZ
MYTVQGLWTQAREQLDVLNIIIANRAYAILQGEFKSVGAGTPGKNANQMLNLDNPHIDWVHMANASGMEAVRVSNIAAFGDAVRAALKRKGPFLIEAVF